MDHVLDEDGPESGESVREKKEKASEMEQGTAGGTRNG